MTNPAISGITVLHGRHNKHGYDIGDSFPVKPEFMGHSNSAGNDVRVTAIRPSSLTAAIPEFVEIRVKRFNVGNSPEWTYCRIPGRCISEIRYYQE